MNNYMNVDIYNELLGKLGEVAEKDVAQKTAYTYHLTDLGNAQFFADMYGDIVKYIPKWQKWAVWGGNRWVVDAQFLAEKYAKKAIQEMYIIAGSLDDSRDREALARHALSSENQSRIYAMLELAKSEPGIVAEPEAFDFNPWLFNVKNGTIDLRTGELRPHDKHDYITKITNIEYDPLAEHPLWDAFLNRIMNGNQTLIHFLQVAAGYSLTGLVNERALFLCYGTGANGKSVFLNTLLKVLGEYGKQVPKELLITRKYNNEHPTIIANLMGVRLGVTIETEATNYLAESQVKWLTGGDMLTARFMRGDYFQFKPEHKLWLATNHKPIIGGSDYAIWSRIKLIPFQVTIPKEEQDIHLSEKLEAELTGILAWCVQGCLEWQKHGLLIPEAVQNATSEYQEEMDTFGDFLEDWCVLEDTAQEKNADLYKAYKIWAMSAGEQILTQKAFTQKMQERGFASEKTRVGKVWHGVRLKPEKNAQSLI